MLAGFRFVGGMSLTGRLSLSHGSNHRGRCCSDARAPSGLSDLAMAIQYLATAQGIGKAPAPVRARHRRIETSLAW